MAKRSKALTVGAIRKAIKGLSDEAEYFPVWANGPPNDDMPGVEITGAKACKDKLTGKKGLAILVDLFELNEEDEDE